VAQGGDVRTGRGGWLRHCNASGAWRSVHRTLAQIPKQRPIKRAKHKLPACRRSECCYGTKRALNPIRAAEALFKLEARRPSSCIVAPSAFHLGLQRYVSGDAQPRELVPTWCQTQPNQADLPGFTVACVHCFHPDLIRDRRWWVLVVCSGGQLVFSTIQRLITSFRNRQSPLGCCLKATPERAFTHPTIPGNHHYIMRA
jgi:hypothetical protein